MFHAFITFLLMQILIVTSVASTSVASTVAIIITIMNIATSLFQSFCPV